MKSSNFIERFVFVALFVAAFFIVSCGNSDGNEDTTDTDQNSMDSDTSDTDITDTDYSDSATDTEPADSSDTTDNTDTADSSDTTDNTDTADSSDTADNTNTADSSDTTDNTDTTDDANTSDESDSDFAQNSEGCTMIEVPKITMGGSYADEINGYFGPSLGDNTIDIIRMYLLGEIQEGTYELGTGINDNYMQCQQCVMVWVDAAAGKAKEYYFQTSGTLQITQVKDVDEIKRTAGVIKNLILKQVEPLNDYLGDFGFINNGSCIAAGIVEWDTTNTPGNSGD